MSISQAWSDLKLSSPVMSAVLNQLNYKMMTPVQAACIPQFMNHKDVAVEAVTGSGKTVAFLVPLLEILLSKCSKFQKQNVYAIIISPTRELATQISEVLDKFLLELPQISRQLLIGGTNPAQDMKQLADHGGNIIVATPGRLHDLLERRESGPRLQAAVKAVEVLVLDEADRLLDLGFERQLNDILSRLPRQRRTGLFSATQTDEVQKLVRAGLRNPVAVTVRERQTQTVSRTPHQLENFYMICEGRHKLGTLIQMLRERTARGEKVMVFFSTCAMVEYFTIVVRQLVESRNVLSIHGKMKNKRFKIFDKFRKVESGVLLCTDVMARGVDIPDVQLVVQYDPPSSAAAFVHRCGRTARIGHRGAALVLLLPSETSYIQFLQLNQKVALAEMAAPQSPPQFTDQLRQLQMADRANYDRATRAFVSFVQAYAKHECRLIFELKELPLGELATAMGLLQMPRMPELKDRVVAGFTPAAVDLSTVPYKNAEREAARQAKLAVYRETGAWPGAKAPKPKPWSESNAKKQQQKKTKQKRREMKEMKKKKRARELDQDEWDELASEARTLKKLKKGKMTKRQFDETMGMEA